MKNNSVCTLYFTHVSKLLGENKFHMDSVRNYFAFYYNYFLENNEL